MIRMLIITTVTLLMLTAIALPQAEFTEHVLSSDYLGANTMDLVDMDGDKDLDIITTATGSAEIGWWENRDSLVFVYHFVDHVVDPSRVKGADLNLDSRMDIICAFDYSDEIIWWENNGVVGFIRRVVSQDFPEARSIDVVDMDNDDDMDIVACGQWRVTWFENTGQEEFIPHDIDDQFPGAAMVVARDYDRDNDIDIFCIAYWWDDTAWWINDGAQNFTRVNLTPALEDPHWIEVIDINGDQDLDVLVSSRSNDQLALYTNRLPGFTGELIPCPVSGPQGIAAADYDLDGDMDFTVAGRADGTLWLFDNVGGDFQASPIQAGLSLCSYVAAGNFDRDNDIDFAATYQGDNTVSVWENSAGDDINPGSMVAIELIPNDPPVIIPPEGGSISFSAIITNGADMELSGYAWAWVVTPSNSIIQFESPYQITMAANTSVEYSDLQAVIPPGAEPGTYLFRGAIGQDVPYPLDMDEFTFEKLPILVNGTGNSSWSWWGFDQDVANTITELPETFYLNSYPNPFNPTTTISLYLPTSGNLNVAVFDLSGRLVSTLASGEHSVGVHSYQFNGHQQATGMYFVCAMIPGQATVTKKIMLMK
jgi:FG-GAP-like repeat/Secretion system C-terminal sorting domain